jgi:hypothetical protein
VQKLCFPLVEVFGSKKGTIISLLLKNYPMSTQKDLDKKGLVVDDATPFGYLHKHYPAISQKQLTDVIKRKGPLRSDIERELKRLTKAIQP